MTETPILDRLTAQDDDIDIEAVRAAARAHAEQGHYTDREEMVGAIENRLAGQIMGWDKYQHLDAFTKKDLREEVSTVANAIADEIER